jgi:hypothetical protein
MGAASQVSFGAGVGGLDTCCFRFETEYPRKAELDCSLCILRLKSSTASGTDIGPRHSITSSVGGMVNPSAHETIYRSLFVQTRGVLKKELSVFACLMSAGMTVCVFLLAIFIKIT